MTRAKQEVALKEQELKRLRQKMTTVRPQRKPRPCVPIPTAVDDEKKVTVEANATCAATAPPTAQPRRLRTHTPPA
eukprot:5668391-Prymnesium_polylepis.1